MAASFRIPSNLLLSILSSELQTTPLNKRKSSASRGPFQLPCPALDLRRARTGWPYTGLPRNRIVDYYVVMMGNGLSNKEKITQYKIKQCRWRKNRWESTEEGRRNSVTNKMMSGEDNRSRYSNSSITHRHPRWRLETYLACHLETVVCGKSNNTSPPSCSKEPDFIARHGACWLSQQGETNPGGRRAGSEFNDAVSSLW
jgi:hypothetical protein